MKFGLAEGYHLEWMPATTQIYTHVSGSERLTMSIIREPKREARLYNSLKTFIALVGIIACFT